ncbi:MAG: T9SS type A sorting domain-containing protein [Flavobacteriales bacterium]|nr:T9SS type A sorting domain-containing protein [Flavobacteriales bacterium]MCB9194075.1 T9SS type A sorting domain-containing protein [Flavobacteriales bacterium]
MKALRPYGLLATVGLIGLSLDGTAQCTNTAQYPAGAVTPDPGGLLTTISTCSFEEEYSEVTNINAGAAYQFTLSSGGYITVHQDTYDGAVIGQGFSPVTVTAATNGDLFSHWNVDANCGTNVNCETTTVQLFLNCTPPTASYTVTDDCVNNNFTITVNVTSLGDATDVDINYNTAFGSSGSLTNLGIGTYDLGPFPVGDVVDFVVAHSSDPACNLNFIGVESTGACPTIITCGNPPLAQTYCYTNNDFHFWHYQSSGTYPLAMVFSSGMIESSVFDHLTIYDGPDNTAPILYQHNGGTEDLTGLIVVGTALDMYMEMSSDGSVSCSTNTAWTWNWEVGCLDCVPPQATFTVVDDCVNQQWSIQVDISVLGSDTDLDITNNGGAPALVATAPGSYTVGPLPINVPVEVTLVNSSNSLCNISSGPLVNDLCPVLVQCGGAELNETYCYGNNDLHEWAYQSTGSNPVAVLFSSGMIESATFDHLTIYDGMNDQAPVLYDHVGGTEDLSGVLAISTGPNIYMKMSSDGSVSCSTNTAWTWNWTVGCLDCTVPEAEYTLVPDCIHREYSIEVDVTSTGDAATVDLVDIYHADTTYGLGVGQHLIGPFPVDTMASVGVFNGDNSLCRTFSPELVQLSDSCVMQDCGPTPYTYCYTDDDDAWFVYQSTGGLPLTISFTQGSLLVNDKIVVYNGLDDYAAVLFNGNLGGNLSGFAISSSNADNALTLRVQSDGSGSCQGGQAPDEMRWDVGCGLVGIDGIDAQGFGLYPNPTNGTLYAELPQGAASDLQVRVFDLSGRVVLAQGYPQAGHRVMIDLSGLQAGNYFIQLVTSDRTSTRQVQLIR